MELSSPTEQEIDGSSARIKGRPLDRLCLPYAFSGRDFSVSNDLYLHKMVDFHETWQRTRKHFEDERARMSEMESVEMDEKYKLLLSNMDAMNASLSRWRSSKNENLFECKVQIQHTDTDWNGHCNLAVYAKYIENALIEYSRDYRRRKSRVQGLTLSFIHEIRISQEKERGKLPFCIVKILADADEKEVVGVVEYESRLCLEFKVALTKYKHDRLFRLRSKL